MYPRQWKRFDPEHRSALADMAGATTGISCGDAARMHRRSLPFYDAAYLIRIRDPGWERRPGFGLFFLHCDDTLHWLDGRSNAIHAVNASAPIRLNDWNVLEYLRFFAYFVRGASGHAFLILQSGDDPAMPARTSPAARAIIDSLVYPPRVEGRAENGDYVCRAVVLHGGDLYDTEFGVAPNGETIMRGDRHLAQLPFKPVAPLR